MPSPRTFTAVEIQAFSIIDMADKYGLSLSETMSIAEIESIANTLHTHGKYLLSQGDGSNNPVLLGTFFPAIVPVGSNMYANGVSVSGDSGTDIKNVFETEEYLKYCQMLRRWKENGWIPDDSLTSGLLVNQLFQNQEIFMTWLTVNPVEKALQEKLPFFSVNMFATTMQTPFVPARYRKMAGESVLTPKIQKKPWSF